MKVFKRLVSFCLVAVMMIMFSSCTVNDDSFYEWYDKSEIFTVISDDVGTIENEPSLVYYKDTKVVYIMLTMRREYNYEIAAYFAPYISENGKYCRYVDGQIVEIA